MLSLRWSDYEWGYLTGTYNIKNNEAIWLENNNEW
jgi:hypothetical protein